MNIVPSSNNMSFQSLHITKKGFEDCPLLADSIIEKMSENKNFDAFVKENDVNVTIKNKNGAYSFTMEVPNPNKTDSIKDILKPNTLKVKYTGEDIYFLDTCPYIHGRYFDENTRSGYVEYGNPYKSCRPKTWLNVRNINEDIESLRNGTPLNYRKMERENKESNQLIYNYAYDDTSYYNKYGCTKSKYTQYAGGN